MSNTDRLNKKLDIFTILDDYFSAMDNVVIGESSIFLNEDTKERHETILMYAFRKYRAACYHLARVNQLLEENLIKPDDSDLLDKKQLSENAKVKISVIRTADHFIYELAAFFEALKSSLDFIASASSLYFKGINVNNSIRTFIKCADKNCMNNSFINVIKKYLVWLKQVRDYRHHLVHRMVITVSDGYEIHKWGDITKIINYPVIVPETTPSYFPDTRRSRMINDNNIYFDQKRFEGTVEYPDGTKKIIDFSVEYKPSKGYKEISEFMTLHLHKFEHFFRDILTELKSMNFMKYN